MGVFTKGQVESFGGMDMLVTLWGGFMGAHICQHFILYTVKTYSILLDHCTSVFKL